MKRVFGCVAALCMSVSLYAQSITVELFHTNNGHQNASIGTVKLEDSYFGMLITPNLHGLTPGLHGFHVHINPDCGNHGLNAGGHLDPMKTGKHLGPYNINGHLGDLPALYVNDKGQAIHPVLAPRLRVKQVFGHSLMVHEGGDNYADTPESLGGGGARIACGVVKAPSSDPKEKPAAS